MKRYGRLDIQGMSAQEWRRYKRAMKLRRELGDWLAILFVALLALPLVLAVMREFLR